MPDVPNFSSRRQSAWCLPGRRCLSLLLLALILGVSGCALQPPQPESGSVMAGGVQGRALDANLNGFLAQSSAGAVLALPSSPWGPNVELMAEAPYRAASGRTCRKLTVTRASLGQARRELACETPQGWVSRRLVTELNTAGGYR